MAYHRHFKRILVANTWVAEHTSLNVNWYDQRESVVVMGFTFTNLSPQMNKLPVFKLSFLGRFFTNISRGINQCVIYTDENSDPYA